MKSADYCGESFIWTDEPLQAATSHLLGRVAGLDVCTEIFFRLDGFDAFALAVRTTPSAVMSNNQPVADDIETDQAVDFWAPEIPPEFHCNLTPLAPA